MLKLLPAMALLVSAMPVVAQIPASPKRAKAEAVNPLDKVVCRVDEATGSRLNRKTICLTLREWKDLQDLNQAELQKLQQQSTTTIPSG